jgi:peptide/nickel transport system substrate-binding protein
MLDRSLTRRTFLQGSGTAALLLATTPSLLAACVSGTKGKSSTALRIGLLTEQDTMNPFTSVDAPELFRCVYDYLMQYDAQLAPKLSLAKTKTASPDGKTITYTLQQGVKFHDGTLLTSADVKFSYDLVKSTGLSGAAFFIKTLVSTEAPDDNTFVAKFSAPPADDPALFIPIAPKHIWGSIANDKIATFTNDAMVGSGPYKFVSWTHNQSWKITRNPDYWGPKPGMETISWVVYQNEETLALAIRQGDISLTYPLSATIFAGLQHAANVAAVKYSAIEFVHFGFNLSNSPKSKGNPLLRDLTLRQAMAHAVDKKKLVELVLEGYGTVGSTIIMPAFTEWFLKIPESEQLQFDPALAKRILDGAGYVDKGSGVRQSPEGKPLHFRLFASTVIPQLAKAAQLVVPMLNDVGIKMDLTVMSDPSLVNQVFTLIDYDCYVWDWFTPPTPTIMLSVQTVAAQGTLSDSYYDNPAYDRLVELQASETDLKTRQALVYQAQKIFYDAVGYIVLFYVDPLMAHRTDGFTGWIEVDGGPANNNTPAGLLALKPA